jgi:alpha-ketoglutarate-dependent taurine dioxygenase
MGKIRLATVAVEEIDVLMIEPSSEHDTTATAAYQTFKGQIDTHLATAGVVLFRGFHVTDARQLMFFALETGAGLWGYANGNSPRTTLSKGVYTASEYPKDLEISLHNELSYAARWPQRLYFASPHVAQTGGVLCFADSRSIYDQMPQYVLDLFQSRGGIRYVRVLPGRRGLGRTWQETFESESLDKVRRFCAEENIDLAVYDNGAISLTNVGQLSLLDPISGRWAWFNQAEQFHPSSLPRRFYEPLMKMYARREHLLPHNAFFADGSPIPSDVLDIIRAVQRDCRRTLPWRPNDVAILNNNLMAHGRLPYTGKRELYVVLTK